MAEAAIFRALRLGTPEGEYALAVMVGDSLDTACGQSIFNHFVRGLMSAAVSGTAQARGLVTIASVYSPDDYINLWGSQFRERIQFVDLFTDPLGWDKACPSCQNVHDFELAVIEAGKVFVEGEANARFAVAFDSISTLLRHHSIGDICNLLTKLRMNDRVSAVIWLVHTDLSDHKTIAALQYMATCVVNIEPLLQIHGMLHRNLHSGMLRLRQKRRTGRVRELIDEFKIDMQALKFSSVIQPKSSEASTNHVHKVQFRLELTKKEEEDRAKVVLPFEHQGAKEVQLYDGRSNEQSVVDASFEHGLASTKQGSQIGEIHYLRDSDDERPDSDEDPDDDLDI